MELAKERKACLKAWEALVAAHIEAQAPEAPSVLAARAKAVQAALSRCLETFRNFNALKQRTLALHEKYVRSTLPRVLSKLGSVERDRLHLLQSVFQAAGDAMLINSRALPNLEPFRQRLCDLNVSRSITAFLERWQLIYGSAVRV
jgi:hypothetical protein